MFRQIPRTSDRRGSSPKQDAGAACLSRPARAAGSLFLLLAILCAAVPGEARTSTDPHRFLAVKEWVGTVTVTIQQSGQNTGRILEYTIDEESRSPVRLGGRKALSRDRASWNDVGHAAPTASIQDSVRIQGADGTVRGLSSVDDGPARFVSGALFVNAAQGTFTLLGWAAVVPVQVQFTEPPEPPSQTLHDVSGLELLNQPLPRSGLVLSGSATEEVDAVEAVLEPLQVPATITWDLRPAGSDAPLKAAPGGPYQATRGETVHLDGSHSRGIVTDYKWTFAAVPGATPPGVALDPSAEKHGASVDVTLLSSVDVTLTVTDGQSQNEKTVRVIVAPRQGRAWKTSFQHVSREGILETDPPSTESGAFVGGENQCAIDPSRNDHDPDHTLHPKADSTGSWVNSGYRVGQVKDPGGPFDGCWYVTAQSLRIRRMTLISKWTRERSTLPLFADGRTFFQGNLWFARHARAGEKPDVRAYLKATRRHELEHSLRIRRALPQNDPAPRLEALFGFDRDRLVGGQADPIITHAEDALEEATQDPLPRIWTGKIVVPDAHGKYAVRTTSV